MISTITLRSLLMGAGTNYALIDARGFESPDIDVSKFGFVGKHGAKIVRALWRDRKIRLEFALRSSTPASYATLRQNLIKAFDLARAGNTDLMFTTLDGKNLQVNVNLANAMDGGFQPGYITAGRIRIELIAGDPNLYGQTLNQQDINPPIAGGVTLPTVIPFALASSGGSATVANNGNGASFPIIRIYGPSTNGHVRNSTLGVQFNIATTIATGDYVEIDLLNQTVLLNGITNYIQYFTGSWWWLEPGNNSIQFNSDGNEPASFARLFWRDAYLGI